MHEQQYQEQIKKTSINYLLNRMDTNAYLDN